MAKIINIVNIGFFSANALIFRLILYQTFLLLININNINCVQLTAYRVESPDKFKVTDDGKITILSGAIVKLRVFPKDGQILSNGLEFSFTQKVAGSGSDCEDLRSTEIFPATDVSKDSAAVSVKLYSQLPPGETFVENYLLFCVRANEQSAWIHQGNSSALQIAAHPAEPDSPLLPIWAKCILILVFISFSGLFTGLGLGLLSLTKLELKVLRNLGSSREKRYAKIVYPLRKKGNFLFCTITFVNALANIAVTILFYELVGLYSIIGATLSIVFIGEVLPQTVCSFVGLAVGTKIIWFTNLFMFLTFPFTYPVGKLMDWMLREEIPSVYNRDRLVELVKAAERRAGNTEGTQGQGQGQGQGGKGGVEGLGGEGVLNLSNKSVKSIMRRLEDVYMLEYNNELDHMLLNEILKAGYTRIPVYDGERSNVVAMLHVADLALVEPNDKTSLKTLCKFYNRPVNFVFEDTRLDVMLEEFKRGQSHMAFLQRVNSDGPGDPFYETLGMLTLEDVINEIFHSDTDSSTDKKPGGMLEGGDKLKGEGLQNINKLNAAVMTHINTRETTPTLSAEMLKAAVLYLAKEVEPLSSAYLTERVLERMLSDAVMRLVAPLSHSEFNQVASHGECTEDWSLYESGVECSHFVMILEGRVEVRVGRDNMRFSCGPFSCFGLQALTDVLDTRSQPVSAVTASDLMLDEASVLSHTFTPDYSVRHVTDVTCVRVTRAMYVRACQASVLQRPLTPRLIGDYLEAPPYDEGFKSPRADQGNGVVGGSGEGWVD